jgi:hypothetical protein
MTFSSKYPPHYSNEKAVLDSVQQFIGGRNIRPSQDPYLQNVTAQLQSAAAGPFREATHTSPQNPTFKIIFSTISLIPSP